MRTIEVINVVPENYAAFKNMIARERDGGWLYQNKTIIYGAVSGDDACGVAILGVHNEIAELIWLYTAPDFRNKGVASSLLEFILKDMSEQKVASIYGIYGHNGNQMLWMDSLFIKKDFTVQTERHKNYQLTFQELLNTPVAQHFAGSMGKQIKNTYALKYIPKYYVKGFLHKCVERGIYLTDKLSFDEYDQNYSTAYVVNSEINGVLLMRWLNEKCLNVEMIFTLNAGMDSVRQMIKATVHSITEDIISGERSDGVLKVQLIDPLLENVAYRMLGIEPYDEPWYHRAKYEKYR